MHSPFIIHQSSSAAARQCGIGHVWRFSGRGLSSPCAVLMTATRGAQEHGYYRMLETDMRAQPPEARTLDARPPVTLSLARPWAVLESLGPCPAVRVRQRLRRACEVSDGVAGARPLPFFGKSKLRSYSVCA